MPERALQYIVVEGPIGVGKTTLARKLSTDLHAELLLEAPQDNPFLEQFYQDPDAFALQTQLSFLLQRADQVDGLRQTDLFRGRIVADFFFDKDPLFAGLTLSGSEYQLYKQVYDRLSWSAPAPDLVVYLTAPVEVLGARVRQRGRDAEDALEDQYLQTVSDAYGRYFSHYDAAPVIAVDAAQRDLVNHRGDYLALLDLIRDTHANRGTPPHTPPSKRQLL